MSRLSVSVYANRGRGPEIPPIDGHSQTCWHRWLPGPHLCVQDSQLGRQMTVAGAPLLRWAASVSRLWGARRALCWAAWGANSSTLHAYTLNAQVSVPLPGMDIHGAWFSISR